MKKVLFPTLFSLAALTLSAQQPGIKPFEIGVHGGWNNTKIYVTQFHTRTHWGYFAGVFGRVNFNRHLYLEPSIDYVHKEVLLERSPTDTKLRNASLDVPVVVGVNIVNFPLARVRGYAGPVASFLFKKMSADLHLAGDHDTTPRIVSSDKSMFYFRAGVGVDVWRAILDINYEVGLKKFSPNDMSIPQSMNVTLGFKIF